jgi:2-deoxy-D-gluconate 3-dehydrogenase
MTEAMRTVSELFRLDGQIAIVTGGAGLLGRQFCRALAQAGARVIVADLNKEDADIIAQQINLDGYQAKAIKADITNPTSVNDMVSMASSWGGKLDILVNSAALDPKFDPQHIAERNHPAPYPVNQNEEFASGAFETFSLDEWKAALEVNLTGVFLCCQAACKLMLKQGKGVIINIGSMYGIVGPDQRLYQRPDQPPKFKPVYYTVSKAGVLGLTRYLATYFAGKNIRVNALTPGGVYNGHDEIFLEAYAARSVLGRMAAQDEMNGALLFLASDASSYMTGANLVVDGGWTAW